MYHLLIITQVLLAASIVGASTSERARRLPGAVLEVQVGVHPAGRRRVAVPAIVDLGPAAVLAVVLGTTKRSSRRNC